MRRVVVVILSDTHANHKLGLLNPEVILYDETEEGEIVPYTPELTASQVYLWKLYKKGIKKAKKLAAGDPIVVVHNGDITQGRRYVSQWVSTRQADEVLIATENMRAMMALPKLRAVRVIFGTGSHVGGEGSNEILVTKQLRASYPKKDIQCYYHGRIEIDGALLDVAHHGPTQSSRIWLEGNIARYYLRDLMMKELRYGNQPPDLVIRSHYHNQIDEVVSLDWQGVHYESRIIVTPAMCMLGDYATQAMRSPFEITNGMALVEIIGGKVQAPEWVIKRLDIRTKESL